VYSPFLPSIPAILLDSGLLLTVLWLCYSLCLQLQFDSFRRRLRQYLPLPDGPTLPTTGYKEIDAALEVLQIEREGEGGGSGEGGLQ